MWRGYELSVAVFEDEITTETVLCHRFLKQGLACWIRALEILKAGNFDPDKVLENAMEGQRLLVMVQIVEDEIAAAASKVFVHWN